MSNDLVLRADADGITTLTLNRPDKLNSLSTPMFRVLDRHVRVIEANPAAVQCVILRGAGRCFSAGHDLGDIDAGEPSEDHAFQSGVIERLANLPQAVVSAVHSHCYTGALELALAGDIILASANAKFADTHAKWALTPVWGMSQRLPRRVGFARAREMMFTSRTVLADEAVTIGLANHVFADDSFDDAVLRFARSILPNSAFSIAAYKRLLADTDGMALDRGLAHEVQHSEGRGPDMAERIASFAARK